MIFIKKIFRFLANLGYSLMQLMVMLLISFFVISIKLVREDSPNPYCKVSNQNTNLELDYKEIDYYTYEVDCNTLMVEVYLIDSIDKFDAVALLVQIKQQLENSNYSIMTHFTLNGKKLTNTMYANLNLGHDGISYVGG